MRMNSSNQTCVTVTVPDSGTSQNQLHVCNASLEQSAPRLPCCRPSTRCAWQQYVEREGECDSYPRSAIMLRSSLQAASLTIFLFLPATVINKYPTTTISESFPLFPTPSNKISRP